MQDFVEVTTYAGADGVTGRFSFVTEEEENLLASARAGTGMRSFGSPSEFFAIAKTPKTWCKRHSLTLCAICMTSRDVRGFPRGSPASL